MTPLLRPAVEGDLTEITTIERASFADPWTEESFRRLLDSKPAIFLVAKTDPNAPVAGYVVAFSVGEDGEILNVAVASEFRGRGLAGQMLDAALIELAGRGVRTAFLEVRESNEAARGLYRSRNFAEIGRRRGYYRRPLEDALVLRRLLDHAGTFADR
jgi:ribosomal-protein-alanine N-acetyltransferase